MRVDSRSRNVIDSPAEEVFEVQDEAGREPGADFQTDSDQQIDVTIGGIIPANNRAKNPNRRNPCLRAIASTSARLLRNTSNVVMGHLRIARIQCNLRPTCRATD